MCTFLSYNFYTILTLFGIVMTYDETSNLKFQFLKQI